MIIFHLCLVPTQYNRGRLRATLFRIIHWARNKNTFKSAASDTNNRIRRDEILATRLYIFLFTMGLLIIIFITVMSPQKSTVVVDHPSLIDYERLQVVHDSVTCSCLNTTIPYSAFVSNVEATTHQVCLSPFVDHVWFSSVFGDTTVNRSIHQAFLSSHFRHLAAFCQSAQQIITDAINDFYSTEWIGITLLTRSDFSKQMTSIFSQFQEQTPGTFRRTLRFILNVTLANQVVSVYESNWHFIPGDYPYVSMKPRYYGESSIDFDSLEPVFRCLEILYDCLVF